MTHQTFVLELRRPDWWGSCADGWCGGAFMCERHAAMLPQLADKLFGPTARETKAEADRHVEP